MDIPQLKLLAGRVRGLLEQHDVPVGHGQSLDLIAALPGLRNWPEVNAFPDRVASCELDTASASRLAYRLKCKHGVEFGPTALVAALNPPVPGGQQPSRAPQVWPSGPPPGVYVTTSQAAINALLAAYDEATDGEVVYAEAAGSHWDGAIDLGEWGLSSNGLQRVPSGTLLVVGPLELTQRSWEASAHKLEWACIRAQDSGHRVAVLVDTPTPELLFKDLEVLVKSVAPADDDSYKALTGVVTEGGSLERRSPFVSPPPVRVVEAPTASADEANAAMRAIPGRVLPLLRQALERRSTGLLVFGSNLRQEHWAIDLVAAAVPLTAGLGPIARIKARNRPTPAKDLMVPDIIKALPFLPSVESAYAHGFRRMVVDCGYTDAEVLLNFDDVLFLMGTSSFELSGMFMDSCRVTGQPQLGEVARRLVALVGVGDIEGDGETHRVCDLYLPGPSAMVLPERFEEVLDQLRASRTLRWEDDLGPLLDGGRVSMAAVKKALGRGEALDDFLARRSKSAKGS
jgi:hypothetical protein